MNNNSIQEKCGELALLLSEKNKSYGNSFSEAHRIIEILWPNGVPSDSYPDFLSVIRIIDKLFRIATDKSAFKEDPWMDIAGYAMLSCVKISEEVFKELKK